jgi:hypothetical protein
MANGTNLQVVVDIQSQTEGLDQEVAQLQVIRAETEKINALSGVQSDFAKEIAAEQAARTATLQQQAAIESQMQVIAQTRFDLTAAQVEGDAARVKQLQSELEVRSASLGVMRAQALTTAELNSLTESEAALLGTVAASAEATAAGGLLASVNLNKARNEAIVLGRELASGANTTRTLGALLGSLGTSLTFVGLGVFELYQGFKSAEDAANDTAKALEKMRNEAQQAAGAFRNAEDARSLSDVVSMADKAKQQLDKMSVDMATFRQKELTRWQKFWDSVVPALSSLSGGMLGAVLGGDSYAAELTREKTEAQENYNRTIETTSGHLIEAANSAAKFDQALEDPAKYLPQYKQNLLDATEAFDRALDALSHKPGSKVLQDAFVAAADKVKTATSDVGKLDAALNKINAGNKSFFSNQIMADLRDAETTLQGIHEQQQLIEQDSSLSADEKQAALLNLSLKEQSALLKEIAVIERDINVARAVGDPAKIAELEQRLQRLNATLGLTKLHTAELAQPLTAELQKWVNSFGTSAHQVANLIEGTINVALQGTNQLLLDSLFRTGDWRQTLVGVERQVLQLFLTWGEQELLQFITGESHKDTSTASTIASHEAAMPSATAHAAAEGISSYGWAAIIGAAAVIAAIAAIEGAFHEGGVFGADLNRGRGRKGPLGADEGMALLRDGEVILTPEQAEHVAVAPYATAKFSSAQLDALGGVDLPPIDPANYGNSPLIDVPSITINPGAPGPGPIVDVPTSGFAGFIPGFGSFGFAQLPGETWLGGGFVGVDPATGAPVYNPNGYQGSTGPTNQGGGYVGGGIAQADLAAMAAAHFGLHMAAGGRIAGMPSSVDNVLNWNATGEHIISAPSAEWADHVYGADFLDSINLRIPRVPLVDRSSAIAASGAGAGASGMMARRGGTNIFVVHDIDEVRELMFKNPAAVNHIVNAVTGNKHTIGIRD